MMIYFHCLPLSRVSVLVDLISERETGGCGDKVGDWFDLLIDGEAMTPLKFQVSLSMLNVILRTILCALTYARLSCYRKANHLFFLQ